MRGDAGRCGEIRGHVFDVGLWRTSANSGREHEAISTHLVESRRIETSRRISTHLGESRRACSRGSSPGMGAAALTRGLNLTL